jgi:hypothetical protein
MLLFLSSSRNITDRDMFNFTWRGEIKIRAKDWIIGIGFFQELLESNLYLLQERGEISTSEKESLTFF